MTADERDPVDRMGRAIGYTFADAGLLRLALTHPSAAGRGDASYERLEFLGDRVLGLVVADLLYVAFPGEAEGDLAQRFVALVRRETLAEVAAEIGLGEMLVLARGEEEGGGRENPTNLSDACEALIGALYIDGGLEAARSFVAARWTRRLESTLRPPRDPKTALQEWAQGSGRPLPVYSTLSVAGPAHGPTFVVEVRVVGAEPATGTGTSKRTAERAAAEAMLARVGG